MDEDFERLLADGVAAPVDGWDFSWFTGRASEARPPWGYQRLLSQRLAAASAAVDLQTGGGEVLAGALRSTSAAPGRVVATEAWRPNLALARQALAPWGVEVLEAAEGEVPLPDACADLVSARHPVRTPWDQVARVLRPGGTFCSQQVGAGTVREVTEALLGPFDVGTERLPSTAVARAEAAGLAVTRLETASLPMTFDDVGAVVAFCRKVVWTVPDFSVDRYREPLRALHGRIVRDGPLRATSERFLIECRKD